MTDSSRATLAPSLVQQVETAVATALGAASADPAAIEARLAGIIAAWVAGYVHNSPIAQSTPAYNHLLAILPLLVAAIAKEV
jgi:hypothetical protein